MTMTNPTFSFNLISDFAEMWRYSFMQHAFEAGTIVAIIAGIIGYFVVLRRLAFAAHALSHIGFTGAAGAVLFDLNPILGLFTFTMGGALAMAILGRRTASRDVQIGIVLAFMLGLGILFISLYTGGYATEVYSILFGEILGISITNVWITLITGILILGIFFAIYKPLLFTSLDEDLAEAKGISLFAIGLIFMLLIAAATSIAVQVVGVLLIFSLMVTPAAAAHLLARRPINGIYISIAIALLTTWFGIFIAFYIPYPVSFFITSSTFILYFIIRSIKTIKKRSKNSLV